MDNNEDKPRRAARAEARRQVLELRMQERWGKVSANLEQNIPTERLNELYEKHKALCFKDVYCSIREASVEYAAKYWMISAQYDRDADIHDAIQARHSFIFPDALYHLRVVEAEIGRRGLIMPYSYFGVTKLDELGSHDFASSAREFLEERYNARENIQAYLNNFQVLDIRSSEESSEEGVANTTRPVLSVFHHDFGNRASKSSLFHNIKNYAMYAIAHPEKSGELESNMHTITQKFLQRIPHIQSIQSFIQHINSQSLVELDEQVKPFAPNVHSLFGKRRIEPSLD